MRQAAIFMHNQLAGYLTEDEEGYCFLYLPTYLEISQAVPISLTMPLTLVPYKSLILFPFFDGLIPEGWLLEIATKNWKINQRDRMGLLLACCKDCIGAVSVVDVNLETSL